MKKIILVLIVFLIGSLVLLYFVISNNNKEETSGYIPIVRNVGSYKSCINCHGNINGFSPSHSPEKIGCESCHLGNADNNNKEEAHKGMISIPGNLSTSKQTCGTAECHPGISERVELSLMSSMSGVISVDKYTFDEIDKPSGKFHVKELGNSAADSHFKNLCASCHLGGEKKEFGAITEKSRGGGCNACHLNYTTEAENELKLFNTKKGTKPDSAFIKFHPSLSLNVTNNHCFGCHSRSGRISTNYEGWHETTLDKEDIKDKIGYRLLQDGRVFRAVDSDVHHKAGMACIDCHTSYEIMGDGRSYEHKEEALRVQCIDCHTNNYETIQLKDFDYESRKIAELRNVDDEKKQFIKVKESGMPLVNTFVNEDGKGKLVGKITGEILKLTPPNFICIESQTHKDVSCNSCHSSWAPQCVGCHTDYDPKRKGYDLFNKESTNGSWVEYSGEFFAELPTLGVIEHKYNEELSQKVEPFIPGMIMTLDKSKYEKNNSQNIFKRLFAPNVPHTIQKESRSCESCHNSSLAIGYGRGELTYETIDNKGVWKFTPTYDIYEYDNLPQDAWIRFLSEPKKNIGTRENVRPFNLEEQKRILTVGTCLTCHRSDSKVMKKSLIDFKSELLKLNEKCILPEWKR